MNGETLYQDRDITITRLDEHRVILRTTPGVGNYAKLAILIALSLLFLAGFGAVLIISLTGLFLGEFEFWYQPGAGIFLGLFGVSFACYIVWIGSYHLLPRAFLVDSDAKTCTQDYCVFFHREIPFDSVDYLELSSYKAPKPGETYPMLYLYRREWPRRVCLYQGKNHLDRGAATAFSILTERFEKAGVKLSKERTKLHEKTHEKVFRGAAWAMLVPVFVVLLVMFFLLAPVFVVWETVDLIRMRATAQATVTATAVKTSEKGSRPVVTYAYVVNGKEYSSDRYLPGYMGNAGTWTGGAEMAGALFEGQEVTIHYDPAYPGHSCLEYGWFKWSIGFTLAVWGIMLTHAARAGKKKGRRRLLLSALGPSMVISAVLLLLVGPNAVRVAQIHWHLLVFGLLFVSSLSYQALRKKDRTWKPTRREE